MINRVRTYGGCLLAVCMILAVAPFAAGQGTTTGNLVGKVVAEADSSALPGAQVTAVHEPTGTRYVAVSREGGKFTILNVRVGGPYKVTADMSGFVTSEQTGFYVRLGEDLNLTIPMRMETFEEELVVTASTPIINPTRMGAVSNVNLEQIEALPTIERGLEDYAKTSIYFSLTASDDGQNAVTVAGRNNRYNNIQIDGAVNNDLFGLAATGTPGGQAETQPISMEAIQEFQLLVSPYDVRQGGFSGGGINAITKSGSNAFKGSAFYYTRSEGLVGDGPDDIPYASFEDTEYGISLGGPLVQDKAFFFVSGEINRRDQPSGWSIGGSGQDFGHVEEAQRFRNIMQSVYGYDPGGFDEYIRTTDSDIIFARADFNLSDAHQLTVRHNWVDAYNDRGYPGPSSYYFPDNWYQFTSTTNSSVVQLNSVVSDNKFNEARITYQTVEENRGGASRFPAITVDISGGDSFRAGTERYSTANALDQDIIELNDDFTIVSGDHLFTIGTHNEFFKFDNLFIRDNYGTYSFRSLDDLERGWAESYDYSFSATDDPLLAAKVKVRQLGFYAGDQWAIAPNMTLTYGLRVDAPLFPDKPTRNPDAEEYFGHRTDVVPDGNLLWSPRAGFNWDINGDGKQQLRGGLGIFSGRPPYVWLSNQFSNTGIEFTRISYYYNWYDDIDEDNHITFIADPYNQPTDIGYASTNEIDLVDPDFKFQQLWRATLGYDRDLGFWGLVGSAELMYSKSLNEILYQNLNVAQTGETLFDGRPLVANVNRSFRDVIYLSNTSKGKSYTAALKLERPFRDGIYASASYIYGRAKSVNDGTSSQARSNWVYLYVVDPNNPDLATSNFEVRHRFMGVFSYKFNVAGLGNTVTLYYNAQSGRPYSTTYSRDVNGDYQSNDLIYVPASSDEVIVENGTWADLDAYIVAAGLEGYRGRITKRNASFAPWTHTLDFRYAIDLPIKVVNARVNFDIENLANLINADSGIVLYAPFNEASPVEYRGLDSATGKPIYRMNYTDFSSRWDRDDYRSRWRAKLGLRLSF